MSRLPPEFQSHHHAEAIRIVGEGAVRVYREMRLRVDAIRPWVEERLYQGNGRALYDISRGIQKEFDLKPDSTISWPDIQLTRWQDEKVAHYLWQFSESQPEENTRYTRFVDVTPTGAEYWYTAHHNGLYYAYPPRTGYDNIGLPLARQALSDGLKIVREKLFDEEYEYAQPKAIEHRTIIVPDGFPFET